MSGYRKLSSNLWLAGAKLVKAGHTLESEPCSCVPAERGGTSCATLHCFNRATKVECDSNCPCGESCCNQVIQRCKVPKTRLVKFPGNKGMGVVADEYISEGTFVGEYLGEIIDQKELARRMREEYSGMRHTYIMTYDKSLMLDATLKGGETRFINHSCDPNCRTEKWSVKGLLRVGIFAIRDISPGEEITYDYLFQLNGHASVPCECGAAACRKFLGGSKAAPAARGQVLEESDDEIEEHGTLSRYATDLYGNATRVQQLPGVDSGDLDGDDPGLAGPSGRAFPGSDPLLRGSSLEPSTSRVRCDFAQKYSAALDHQASRRAAKVRQKPKSPASVVEYDSRSLQQILTDSLQASRSGLSRYPSVFDQMAIDVHTCPRMREGAAAIEAEFAQTLHTIGLLTPVLRALRDSTLDGNGLGDSDVDSETMPMEM